MRNHRSGILGRLTDPELVELVRARLVQGHQQRVRVAPNKGGED